MEIKIIASGSTGNCYRVGDGETEILLDAGVPASQIREALDYRLHEVAGCLITHSHGDHIRSAKDLIRSGIDVYMSKGAADAAGLGGHRVKIAQAHNEIRIGTFVVLPFDVQHDAPEPLGFLLTSSKTGERLLYFTDTYYLKYTFSGLTHIMGECNYSIDAIKRSIDAGYIPQALAPRLIKSHMSLEHFLEMLKANDLSNVRQIYLLHLSANNSNEDAFRDAVRRATGTEVYVC